MPTLHNTGVNGSLKCSLSGFVSELKLLHNRWEMYEKND